MIRVRLRYPKNTDANRKAEVASSRPPTPTAPFPLAATPAVRDRLPLRHRQRHLPLQAPAMSSVVNSRPALKPTYIASMIACSSSAPT